MEQKKLAELWVEFKAKGDKLLEQSLDDTKKKLEDTDKKTVGFKKTMEGLQNTFRLVRIAAVASIGQIVNQVTSLARAGLNLSMEGQYLQTQFQYLSREVANLFIPVIREATNALRVMIDWFRSLDAGQQRALGNIVAVGSAFIGITGAVLSATTAIGAIGAALGTLGAVVGPIVAAGAAIGALVSASESGNRVIAAIWAKVQEVFQMLQPLFQALVFVFNEVSEQIARQVLGAIGDTSSYIAELGRFVTMLTSVIRDMAPTIGQVFGLMAGWVRAVYRGYLTLYEILLPLVTKILEFGSRIGQVFARVINVMRPVIEMFQSMMGMAFDNVLNTVRLIIGTLIAGLEMAIATLDAIANRASTIAQAIAAATGNTALSALVPAIMATLNQPVQPVSTGNFSNGQAPQSLTPRGGGFEDVRAAFRRFQEEAVRAGGGPEQQTADNTAQAVTILNNLLNFVQQNGPMLFQALSAPQPVNGGPA